MHLIFKRSSLDSMIRSVRSKLSLASLQSSSKDRSNKHSSYEDIRSLRGARDASKENPSIDYNLHRLYGGRNVEGHVANGKPEERAVEEGGIRVKGDLIQESSYL